MTQQGLSVFLIFFFFSCCLTGFGQHTRKPEPLILFRDTVNNECGYRNLRGEIIIPSGRYSSCFTDTFRTYAIVGKVHTGFFAVDRSEKVLYRIFTFDNGPDYTSDGLFRIISKGKIGYADSVTGRIAIPPRYVCAFPFENGRAKVSVDCYTKPTGEHSTWVVNTFYFIDKRGEKLGKIVQIR